MFITIKYNSYEELIPISSIIKFARSHNPIRYEITLTSVTTTKNFIWNYGDVKNTVIEVSQETQPLAFTQIQDYLSQSSNL